ncbi:hypothetical protein Pmani_010539 [Petrolisthes manimaculis]|uniref:IRS-type PTB domain-containing protein n=1 Tax=Petrolisthes manimaculis TaxID=1843537 RepID=A0AAE1UFF7_9EUCA|nr:hypothetical protein Pmani_010539 [Petrolisthes manimaculis]
MATCINSQPDVVKEGIIYYHPRKQLFKKKLEWHGILFRNSDMGFARLELFESKKDASKGNYTLLIGCSDVIKIQKFPDPNQEENKTFVLSMKDQQQHTFSGKNIVDCDLWLKDLKDTIFLQTVLNSNAKDTSTPEQVTTVNDIYITAEEVCREYTVTLNPDTRKKLMVDGQVRLLVENGHITLISKDNNRIVRWAIVHLRRLGYSDENFHIEAGRKSERGEGSFVFLTNMGKQIHTLVNKEKGYCRQQNNGQSKGISLPAGQVLLTNLPTDTSSSPLRNHEYEDLTTLRMNYPNPQASWINIQSNPSNGKSHDPPSLPLQPPPNTIPTTGIKSLSTSGSGKPLNHGNKQPSLDLQAQLTNLKKFNTDASNIYNEPVIHLQAWKNFGRDEEEDEVPSVKSKFTQPNPESTYDNLTHFNPSITQMHEDPYHIAASGRPEAEGVHMETKRMREERVTPNANEQQQQPEESIYATVDYSMKTKNRK